MRRRIAIPAVLALLAVLAPLPAAPLAGRVDAGMLDGGTCAPVPHIDLRYHPAQIDAGADVPCARDPVDTAGAVRTSAPPDGTDCSHREMVPARSTVHPDGSGTVDYVDPRTGAPTSVDVSRAAVEQDFSPPGPGEHEYLLFPFQGMIQDGVCVGSLVPDPCRRVVDSNGAHTPLPACMVAEPIPLGGALPPAFVQGFFVDLQGQLRRQLSLGAVRSVPARQGLVQLASCFWLEGATALPPDEWLQLVIAGPDGIVYTLRVHLSTPGVSWQFDDPKDPGNSVEGDLPGPCRDPGRQMLTAHRYTQRSDGGPEPDGAFHVSARLTYSVEAWQYWFDTGPHAMAIDLGEPGSPRSTLTLTTPDYAFTVIQEEGVPIG